MSKIRWEVDKENGCITDLRVGDSENLARFFGFTEVLCEGVHYKQTQTNDVGVIGNDRDVVIVSGNVGPIFFITKYRSVMDHLYIDTYRMYTREVNKVKDDSICFICSSGWPKQLELYSPTDEYYRWFAPSKKYNRCSPKITILDSDKPRRGISLFGDGFPSGWAKIVGDKYELCFGICTASCFTGRQHRIVEFKSRARLEFEYQFGDESKRKKGIEQYLGLLITGKEIK